MKISKVNHNGNVRYRVNEAQGGDGKRQRKFFETREAAELYVKQRTADAKAYGVHFATIPTTERASIGYQLEAEIRPREYRAGRGPAESRRNAARHRYAGTSPRDS